MKKPRTKSKKKKRAIRYGAAHGAENEQRALHTVMQEHDTGCAVACAAMVAGVSYKKALKAIHGTVRVSNKSATIAKMSKGLRALGVATKKTGRFMQLKKPAIMMFEWPFWPGVHHCVVYDPSNGGRILDPSSEGYDRAYYLRQWRRSGRPTLTVTAKKTNR